MTTRRHAGAARDATVVVVAVEQKVRCPFQARMSRAVSWWKCGSFVKGEISPALKSHSLKGDSLSDRRCRFQKVEADGERIRGGCKVQRL